MAYEKQTWVDDETIVDAARMEHIEEGIVAAEKLAEEKITNPATGAVGQILEVETVDVNGKPLTYKAVDKPKVEETPERTVIIEEQMLPFNVEDGYGVLEITEPSMVVPVIEGENYIVVLDEEEYKCVGKHLSAEIGGTVMNCYYIGNAGLVNMGENTGERFGFVYILESNSNLAIVAGEDTTHRVGIYQEKTEGLPEVTTADNGKLLQVVNGKWTAVAITNGNEVAY